MMSLKEKYNKEVVPAMKEKFGYENEFSIPKLVKVVVNIGINQNKKDKNYMDTIMDTMIAVSGQKPVETKAKKSIAGFKIREGGTVGMMTTIRGKRMYDFAEKLIHVTLPRIRDFRGLNKTNVDDGGNLNLGFRENIAFPEIKSDEVEKIHGLQVTLVSNAKSKEEGLELFKLLGFPIKQD